RLRACSRGRVRDAQARMPPANATLPKQRALSGPSWTSGWSRSHHHALAPLLPVVSSSGNVMNKTVLVADDDASTRFVLSRALEDLGCQVVLTEDGTDVPELVTAHRFDLLVIDLYMPGLNGFGVLRRIRQPDPGFLPVPLTSSTVPVLVVSGEG